MHPRLNWFLSRLAQDIARKGFTVRDDSMGDVAVDEFCRRVREFVQLGEW